MNNIKYYIGPMSKNIVDAIIEYVDESNINVGIIASRRQIDFDGGYVNNWNTNEFHNYIKSKNKNIILVRDHCGPNQGKLEDDGIESFIDDCKYFDIIHIDVWKKYPDYEEGLNKTIEFIKLGFKINNNLLFEIGTEESIRKFSIEEIERLINDLSENLTEDEFNKIYYCVIQSGTALLGYENIGKYDSNKLEKMIYVVKKNKMFSKEHNGDFLKNDLIKEKFDLGLDAINVAPEYGHYETDLILEEIQKTDNNLFYDFYDICLKSKKWEKWVSSDFVPDNNKYDLIKISGHYVFSTPEFLKIKERLDKNIDIKIKKSIKAKISNFMGIIK
jgi:hypothetical protein